MMQTDTKRNRLFGRLALRNDLIDRDASIAAFRCRTCDLGRTLADDLRSRLVSNPGTGYKRTVDRIRDPRPRGRGAIHFRPGR